MTIDQQFLILKGCLYDLEFYTTIQSVVKSEDFEKELKIIWKYIQNSVDISKEVPKDNFISDLDIKSQIIDKLKAIKVNTSIILYNINKDIYVNKFREKLEESLEILNIDTMEQIKVELLDTLNSISLKSLDCGHNIRDDLELEDIEKPICKFNIPFLDKHLKGLFKKRLYTIIAPINTGKSWFFVHLLSECIKQNISAVLYSLEMDTREYKNRLLRCLTNLNNDERITQNRKDNFYELLDTYLSEDNAIYIKELVTGSDEVEFIDQHLDSLYRNKNFIPKVIFIDYADLFKINKNKDLRHELDHIFKYLRKIAVERNICVWTASQVNRESFSKKNIKMENVAEDIRKMAISDVVVGLNQAVNDKDASNTKLATLYIGKNRMGERNLSTQILTDYYNAKFFVNEINDLGGSKK